LTIIGLTGMIKYIAQLAYLRPAHGGLGRLKTAMTKDGYRYMTPQQDRLVPFPTSKPPKHRLRLSFSESFAFYEACRC